MDKFDFDDWALLYRHDPAAFEARRQAVLALELAKVDPKVAEPARNALRRLEGQARQVRRNIWRALRAGGSGHAGGSSSAGMASSTGRARGAAAAGSSKVTASADSTAAISSAFSGVLFSKMLLKTSFTIGAAFFPPLTISPGAPS